MRIIGGSERGRRLSSLKGQTTRPTADMVKEALFNMLAERTDGAVVLDLFAGSGALGIEALSRGAERATFVENDRRAVAVIRDNLERSALAVHATVLPYDALKAVPQLGRTGQQFDLIFADPPYRRQLAAALVPALASAQLLADDGRIVIEHDRQEELPLRSANIGQIRAVRYGDTVLTFYSYIDDSHGTT